MILNYKLLIDITDYIILYPIRWYNFIKRVINSSTAYNNILIVTKKIISDRNAFDEIIDILKRNQIIVEISENIDFLIYYFKNDKYVNVLSNWLNLITLRATVDLYKEVKCGDPLLEEFFIIVGDKKIIISDVFLDDNNIYVTLLKHRAENIINYTYSYYPFKNEIANIIQ